MSFSLTLAFLMLCFLLIFLRALMFQLYRVGLYIGKAIKHKLTGKAQYEAWKETSHI